MDLEQQKEHFKNHIATFTDYGNIKILDFKNPDSGHYRIRFLFEEDYCRLHISGDLGHLTATNFYNMTFEKFERDFANNTGYFKEKIDCHDRALYRFEEDAAREEIEVFLHEYDLEEPLMYSLAVETVSEAIDEILEDFDSGTGIAQRGFNILYELAADFYSEISDLGKTSTGILDLYMLAYRLAMQQLREE